MMATRTTRKAGKGLLTRIGDAVEAAGAKAQEVGATIARKARVVESKAEREATVAQADAKQALGNAKRAVMRRAKETSEPAAEPRPGPTGMPLSRAKRMKSQTIMK